MRVEQRVADDGLVRDHEHVRLTAFGRQIDDDVLDRQALSRIANAVDHLSPQPGRALLRMRRDDDLGRPRLEHRDRVAHRVGRIGLDHEPVRRDARLVQRSERPVEASAGRRAPRVLVDDVRRVRVADRSEDGDEVHAVGGTALQRLDQARPGDRLVGDDQDVAHVVRTSSTSSASCSRAPLKTACRAPSTPYS